MSGVLAILFSPIRPPLDRLAGWLARRTVVTAYGGVSICHSRLSASLDTEFEDSVRGALRLVEQSDPLRFARITQSIRYVRSAVWLPGTTAAQYVRSSRVCEMEWTKIRVPDDPQLTVFYTAVTLVHEATHGLLIRRGVAHTPSRRSRIEDVCRSQEAQFIRHLDSAMGKAWLLVSRGIPLAPVTLTSLEGFEHGLKTIREKIAGLQLNSPTQPCSERC